MRRAVVAFLAAACSRPPLPAVIAVDPDLPHGVQDAAVSAAEAWCSVAGRTGWCPAVVVGLEGDALVTRGHWRTEMSLDGLEEYGAWAHNDNGERVEVSANMLTQGFDGPEIWAGALLHEFGHFDINDPEHDKRSPLMRARHESAFDYPELPDDVALDMWCEQQGC